VEYLVLAPLFALGSVATLAAALFAWRVDTERRASGEAKAAGLKERASRILGKLASLNARIPIGFYRRYMRWIERELDLAGRPAGLTADRLAAIKLALLLLGPLFYLYVFALGLKQDPGLGGILLSASAAYVLPDLVWLRGKARDRQMAVERALPDFLDMLVLAVDAGLDLNRAVEEVTGRVPASPLHDELLTMQKEVGMGRARADAWKALAARCEVPPLLSFTTAVAQALRMGGNPTPVLHAQAEYLRIARSLRAEKLAAEAPVKMLLPMVLLIFPCIFIILFGPIAMSLMRMM
jgi:tight adherence protein C